MDYKGCAYTFTCDLCADLPGRSPEEIEDKAVDTRLGDLRAAKHRFESSQKPLGRAILCFDALIASSLQMVRERRKADSIGIAALRFLDWLSDEAVLQVALLADAGDEHSILLRHHDKEDFELASSGRATANFLERVHCLFLEEACWKTGYTAHALHLLKKPRTVWVDGASPKTIGGPSRPADRVRHRCLARMKNWVF